MLTSMSGNSTGKTKAASFDEILQDKRLGINAVVRDEMYSDDHHSPYKPAPYSVPEGMADKGIFKDISHRVELRKNRKRFFYAEFVNKFCAAPFGVRTDPEKEGWASIWRKRRILE